jgi:hypothetical protein
MLVYEPSKPSSLPSTDVWLCLHCFIGWLGREIRNGHTDRSAGVLWIASGALFLGSSGPDQLCWWLRERLLYVDHVRYIWSRVIRGPSMESVWRVGRGFPYRVYINSNCRDSQIWVTTCLLQSARSNLMNLISLIELLLSYFNLNCLQLLYD